LTTDSTETGHEHDVALRDGNSISGDFTASDSGTTTTHLHRHETNYPLSVTLDEDTTDDFSSTDSGNEITGDDTSSGTDSTTSDNPETPETDTNRNLTATITDYETSSTTSNGTSNSVTGAFSETSHVDTTSDITEHDTQGP